MSLPKHIHQKMLESYVESEIVDGAQPYSPDISTKIILSGTPVIQKALKIDKRDDPWRRFEYRSVLAYTGNRDRIDLLLTEFDRIGLRDVQVKWNCNNVFVQSFRPLHNKEKDYSPAIFNNTLGHYAIIKTAYELGYKSCLVMEDDIRFLRDVEKMISILDDMPSDFDIAMLDSIASDVNEGRQVSEYWRTLDNMWSAACYALSRRGMEYMIEAYESSIAAEDGSVRIPFRSSDEYFQRRIVNLISPGLKMYYATPCVARQTAIPKSKTNTNYAGWSRQYDSRGCERGNYGI